MASAYGTDRIVACNEVSAPQKGDMTWPWVGYREDKERAISGIRTNRFVESYGR